MTASDAARHVPVVIVGGGPVGLTMALELESHGVGSLLIEPRAEVEHSRPRAKTTSARTMELYRRTGAAAEIRRRAPIPADWSDEVRFCTTATGHEITRLTGVLGLELLDSELTAEGAQQVTQPIVEEALRALLAERSSVATAFGSRVIGATAAETKTVQLQENVTKLETENGILRGRVALQEATVVVAKAARRGEAPATFGGRRGAGRAPCECG